MDRVTVRSKKNGLVLRMGAPAARAMIRRGNAVIVNSRAELRLKEAFGKDTAEVAEPEVATEPDVDQAPDPGADQPTRPPESGRGSGDKAWREYAAALTQTPLDAWMALGRADIIANLAERESGDPEDDDEDDEVAG